MRKIITVLLILVCLIAIAFVTYFYSKYHTEDMMIIDVEEVTLIEYPEDPSIRSKYYNKYSDRQLILIKNDATHFDFLFESKNPKVATLILRDIDISLFVPVVPTWVRDEPNLEFIALSDREWNRQQVSFTKESPHVEIIGGDGFEEEQISSIALARNCLNAGLWELLLFTEESHEKSLYYQGWFNFPLGHYKEIFEDMNQTSYWWHWHRLEHWVDPQGTPVNLSHLRDVISEHSVNIERLPDEKIIAAGEQLRKAKIVSAPDITCWKDFCEEAEIQYASFIKPGRYSVAHPWNHEYERIAGVESAVVRKIKSPATQKELDELEVTFRSSKTGELQRFIISGFDIDSLPQLPERLYPEGLYMPMGISVPPFYQKYQDLKNEPPEKQPYFSLLLDEKGEWINHHEVAIDGPVLHRDVIDPYMIHFYILSYERQSLVGHFIIKLYR
jgi:hypothetical protein